MFAPDLLKSSYVLRFESVGIQLDCRVRRLFPRCEDGVPTVSPRLLMCRDFVSLGVPLYSSKF